MLLGISYEGSVDKIDIRCVSRFHVKKVKKKTEARETDEVPSPQDERVQAKVEEIDAQMQYLQQRRNELLTIRGTPGSVTTDATFTTSADEQTQGPLEGTDR